MNIPLNVVEMECDVYRYRVASRLEVLALHKKWEADSSPINWLRYKVAADSYSEAQYWDWLEARDTVLAEAMP